jgi:hypothetical protein
MFASIVPYPLVRFARGACSSIGAFATALALAGTASASAFTPGNLVVVRIGTGAAGLSNAATAVFLDEYTPTGTFVQTVAMPTAVSGSNFRLCTSGTATSEGALSMSEDGQYFLLTGYDAAPGTTGPGGGSIVNSLTTGAGAVVRVIGRVALDGTVDTSTTTTSFSANNIRAATSTNGVDLWAAGANTGIIHNTLGGSGAGTIVSSNQVNNRTLRVVGGQLYSSSGSGTNTNKGVNTIGAGTPTNTGNLETRLPGLTDANNPSNYAFFFADLDGSVAGVDTLYTADDTNGAGGGITKFSLVGGSWVKNNSVGATADTYRGISGYVTGSTVTLFATRKGGSGAAGGGEITTLVDSAGYNANNNGTPSAALVIAATNTSLRGIAYLPTCTAPVISVDPSNAVACVDGSASFGVTASGSATLSYQWKLGGTPLSDGGSISGAQSATLTINPVANGDYGNYTCEVSNGCGSATSSVATLAIDPTDSDGDGTPDCIDGCPSDPNKIAPGTCGCGVSDVDTDGDGTPDCIDGCPSDPNKIAPGQCGCGVSDVDTDGDGTADCIDGCPNDPNKIAPGQCGCGNPDTDTDGDGVADCVDNCVAIANPGQEDCDLNGVGDVCEIAANPALDRNLNGIPDNCEPGLVLNYCTAGTSTNGCVPAMSAVGTPSVSALSGFSVGCSSLEGQKFGLVFYGISGKKNSVWAPGSSSFLCVKSPTQRTPPANSGGTVNQCDGAVSIDFLAYLASHPTALGQPFSGGDQVFFQTWYRDPSAPATTNLSDALQVTLAP